MSNTSLSKMFKTDLESFFFPIQKLSSFRKSWIFSFNVGNSHHYTENRFLLGEPGPTIQRTFRLGRWKRCCFSCHWHRVSRLVIFFFQSYTARGIWAVRQWHSIRAAFKKKVSGTQHDSIGSGAPFSHFFFLRNRVKLFCEINDDFILTFAWRASSRNDGWRGY